MDIIDEKISVYIKTDKNNNIVSIDSSIFLKDVNGWIKVDEGNGDKYAHAQNYYLGKSLYVDMIPRYKYVDGAIIERTVEEIEKDKVIPEPKASLDDYLVDLDFRICMIETEEKK